MDLKTGDRVRITKGPINKVGKEGIVKLLIENGAFIQLDHPGDEDRPFTPIQFIHLEKISEE